MDVLAGSEAVPTPLYIDVWSTFGELMESQSVSLEDAAGLDDDELIGAVYTAAILFGVSEQALDNIMQETGITA